MVRSRPPGVHREHNHHKTISSHSCCARVLRTDASWRSLHLRMSSNVLSWNAVCVCVCKKKACRAAKFFLERPLCRWHLLSGESPKIVIDKYFTLVNKRSNNGVEQPTGFVHVRNGLPSTRRLELVESFVKVVHEDLQTNEELSNARSFTQDRRCKKIVWQKKSLLMCAWPNA